MCHNGMNCQLRTYGKISKMMPALISTFKTSMLLTKDHAASFSLTSWILFIPSTFQRLWHMHHNKDLQLKEVKQNSTQSRQLMNGWLSYRICRSNHVSCYMFMPNRCFPISEKNGKTLHLLKQSAKTIASSKKRKTVPLLGSIKDYHMASQNATGMSQHEMNDRSGS